MTDTNNTMPNASDVPTKELANSLDKSLKALADTSVLSAGGLAAYGVYVVAVIIVLFIVVRAFSASVSALLPQLITASGLLLVTGLAGAALASYLQFRSAALAAQLESEKLKLKVELSMQRGSFVVSLLENWSKNDYQGFSKAMNDGKLSEVLNQLDRNYLELGVGGEVLSKLQLTQGNNPAKE